MLNNKKKITKKFKQEYQFFFLLDTFKNKLIHNNKDLFFFSTVKSMLFKTSLNFKFNLGKYKYNFSQTKAGIKSFNFTTLYQNNFFFKYTPGVKIWMLAQLEDKILLLNSLGLTFVCSKEDFDNDYTYGNVEKIQYESLYETYNKFIVSRTKNTHFKRNYRFSYINYFKKRRKLTKQKQLFLVTEYRLKEYPQYKAEKIIYQVNSMATSNKNQTSHSKKKKKEILLGLKKVFSKDFFKK